MKQGIEREAIREHFAKLFGRYAARIEPMPDEPELLGIGVYGVPREEMAMVRTKICEAEDSEFSGLGIGLIPMVRSVETTAKHYPEWMPMEFFEGKEGT